MLLYLGLVDSLVVDLVLGTLGRETETEGVRPHTVGLHHRHVHEAGVSVVAGIRCYVSRDNFI